MARNRTQFGGNKVPTYDGLMAGLGAAGGGRDDASATDSLGVGQ